MCQKCVNAIKKHWPDLSEEHYGALLYNATSYPMGSPEEIEVQVKDMAERSRRNLDMALAIADTDLEEALQACTAE